MPEEQDVPDLLDSWEEIEQKEADKRKSRQPEPAAVPASPASMPPTALPTEATPQEALQWAAKMATEAEEIINSILLTSVNMVLPKGNGRSGTISPSRAYFWTSKRRTTAWSGGQGKRWR